MNNKWNEPKRIDQVMRQTLLVWRAKIKLKKLKEKHILNTALFEPIKHYVSNSSCLTNLTRSAYGDTEVYLSKDVVLKKSQDKNWKRFLQMKNARDLCEKNDYKNLVIPKAKVYKNFIVEEKLPIAMKDHWEKEQIGFYTQNRDKFTAVVKEFTGFLYQSTLSDIVRYSVPFYYEGAIVGRYDNVPLYLEEDQGKIGLIDLETFKPKNDFSESESYAKCKSAVCLFPYHFDEIIETAKKFDPDITKYRKELEKHRDVTLQAFEKIYEKHVHFLIENGISIENPSGMIELTADTRNRIVDNLQIAIDKDVASDSQINVVDLQEIKKNIPCLLDVTIKFFSESLFLRTTKNITSYREVALHRTLQIASKSDLTYEKTLYNEIRKALGLYDDPKTACVWHLEFIEGLIGNIFQELKKEKVIQYSSFCGKQGYCIHL